MKKCPYCAEEIQDEAILCRYCGSDLRRPADEPHTDHRFGQSPPGWGVDSELKQLIAENKKIHAIKLVRERKPELGLAAAKAYVDALEKGLDPNQAAAAAPRPSSSIASNASLLVYLIIIALGAYLLLAR